MRLREKGFTLIELLVVVTIIGILSSIVVASLRSARVKARDVTRLADLRQVALGLEFYIDHYRHYPPITGATTAAQRWLKLKECLEANPACTDNSEGSKIMPATPDDPLFTGIYEYDYSPDSSQSSFVLKAILEDINHGALITDVDGVQTNLSNINCDDPSYCLKI